jgi:tetratricopeptide (TPR) repeat protein
MLRFLRADMASHRHRHHRPPGFHRPAARPAPIVPGLGSDLPELQKARALWQLNRFDEALEAFDRAVRLCPQNVVALIDASRAFGARFEIARAEALLDRLIGLGARNPQILHLAGQSYRMIFRPGKAIECFQRALALSRDLPDALLELAVLYERRHRLDEAFTCVEDCLRCAPDYLEARLIEARLLRRRKDPAGSESILRQLAANPRAHPLVQAQAWAEIAQLLDRNGEYAQAIEAMLKCKHLLLRDEAPIRQESDAIVAILRSLAESLTREDLRRWTETARPLDRQKVALLTSFPRSGTTLLEQVLDSHPGLVSSDERELFPRDIFPAMWMSPATRKPTLSALGAVPPERLAALRGRYLSSMAAALNQPLGDRVHLDKNPSFTLLIPAMLRLFPEVQLLIALRDPRDVVLSCFMQFLPLNTNSVCYLSLERAVERYRVDMGVWRKLRDVLPDGWLEVRYEDAVADLEREARRALAFLGLPWHAGVLGYRDRLKEKAVSSPTYEAVSQPLYTRSIGRWKHYEPYLAPLLPRLQPFVDAFGYR